MPRGRKKKSLSIKPIICITTIAILNFIGISYGVWNDNLNLDFGITTGYIEPKFHPDSQRIIKNNNGELTLTLSKDKRILTISGEIYPSFNKNVSIGIENKGSIPVILDDIGVINDDEIIKLNDNKNYSIEPNKEKEFKIHIKSPGKNNKISTDDIEALIDELKVIEKHTFKYELQFEQGVK